MADASPELIEAARRGDEKALSRLLAVCQPDLRRYARRVCATEDIEDAVQDALIILHRRLGALRTLAAFAGWMFQIVKRECLRRFDRRAAGRMQAGDDVAGRPDDPDLRLDLARAIGGLEPLYRDVLILRDFEECTAEETATRVGASVDAVKSRLHRARHMMRLQLSREF